MSTLVYPLKECSVIIVGDVILDVYFMGEVKRVSPEAPVPLVRVREKLTTLGGAGNVALNIVGLGGRATLVGIRGTDDAGKCMSALLEQHGVWDGIVEEHNRVTTSKTRVIGHGQHLIRLDEEETRPGSPAICEALLSRFSANLPGTDIVILSDYAKGVLEPDVTMKIITQCREVGIPVLVDPRGRRWEHYRGATCITPNTGELEIAAGVSIEDDEALLVDAGSRVRRECAVPWLLVTRGAKGMCLLGDFDPPVFVGATAREVYDVSGAGDTVIATLAVGLSSGMGMAEAAAVANVAAGIVVGKLGSQPIRRSELEGTLSIAGLGARAAGMGKITTLEAAQAPIRAWQAAGERVVYIQGVFDSLRPAHITALRRAKELGQRLVVGLLDQHRAAPAMNGDGPGPTEHDRAFVLSAIGCTDLIVLNRDHSIDAVLAVLRPDVIAHSSPASDHALGELENQAAQSGLTKRETIFYSLDKH